MMEVIDSSSYVLITPCGMGRKTRRTSYFTCNYPVLQFVLFLLLLSTFPCVEMGAVRKNEGFTGGGISSRNPFLENRRSFWSSSSAMYNKGRLLYNDDSNRNGNGGGSGGGVSGGASGLSGINNQYAKNLLRSSTSALLDNTLLTRRLYHQQQQLQNNRVTTLISPDERHVLSSNNNRNSNHNLNNNDNNNGIRRGSGRRSSKKKSYPPRPASVNSILSLDSALSVWDDSNSICHTIPGLTREQMELCIRAPETTKVALQGIKMATDECAFQMTKHRWNCSSLQGTVNPHGTQLFQKGYRESAFGHAIAAAGVAYAVAKACSQGKLLSCGCGLQYDDQVNYIPSKEADYAFDEGNEAVLKKNSISSWKWSGCSHNMDYGMKFAKLFLDAREKSHDLPAMTNLHNNKVGRVAVSANMDIRCKCHGLSGSCEIRTCWRSSSDFRRIGSFLKQKFRKAVMVEDSHLGNRPLSRVQKLNKQRRKRRERKDERKKRNANIDLFYYERSPTYCEANKDLSIPGTSGRPCNKTAAAEIGGCAIMCCGRGWTEIVQTRTERCKCQFFWCCKVECQVCSVTEYVTICK